MENKRIAGISIILGGLVITSALVWGLVIIGTSAILKGTECYGEIQNILVGGVVMHIFMIGGITPLIIKQAKKTDE